eukprot:TRINITY_DN17013_c0_g1_i1.p1 TRINITY_DN17013_c0_g1~~TRINITY_DN17013_c0_g1_i1.p1  ORF type:complete len:206 (-),score=96.47 TRINITY_DN17013_c0_g1_i1:80-697(-)
MSSSVTAEQRQQQQQEVRAFHSLLLAVMKREYEGDTAISIATLKEKLFPALAVEDVQKQYNLCKELLAKAAYEDYDATQLETFLKLKKVAFSPLQKEVMLKFWKNQKAKIHEVLRKRFVWNNTLQNISWRMDVKTKSRDIAEMNEQTAIVEITLNNGAKEDTQQSAVRFELDKTQLGSMVAQIEEIEAQIKRASEADQSAAAAKV